MGLEYRVPDAEAVQNALPLPQRPGTDDTPHVKRVRLVSTRIVVIDQLIGSQSNLRLCHRVSGYGRVWYVGFGWLNASMTILLLV